MPRKKVSAPPAPNWPKVNPKDWNTDRTIVNYRVLKEFAKHEDIGEKAWHVEVFYYDTVHERERYCEFVLAVDMLPEFLRLSFPAQTLHRLTDAAKQD